MPLQATLESLEALPEEFHEDYVQQEDGTYKLKILDGYVPQDQVEDVSGLKSALQKERENARKASKTAAQLKEQYGDIDPEDYQRLKELEAQQEEEKAKKAGEWDKLKAQMKEAHESALAKKDKEIGRHRAALERRLIDAEAAQALNEMDGNATLLLPHVKAHVQVVEDDAGDFVARVVDDAGNPRVDGDGKFLTVRDLVREMREQDTFAAAFKSQMKPGGGTPPGGGGGDGGGKGGIPKDLKRGSMTPKEKVAFIKEHGEDEFLKLPA